METLQFELTKAQSIEAERRLTLLGDLIDQEYSNSRLRERARQVLVPVHVLWTWYQARRQRGKDGLLPTDWSDLDEQTQAIVRQRYQQLGALFNTVEITTQEVDEYSAQHGWTKRTGFRWFQRARIGGVWGLAPGYHLQPPPTKKAKKSKKAHHNVRALGTLDAQAFEEIERRLTLLGPLAQKPTVSRVEVREQAATVGVSERTLWNYWLAKRDHGLAGLAPKQRSDKGDVHKITPEMQEIIRGLWLARCKKTIRLIHEEACARAQQLGEPEPSPWQVRMIGAHIPQPDKLLAHQQQGKFRNKYAFTRDQRMQKLMEYSIIYEIDWTRIDVLVKDERKTYAAKSGSTRPYLLLCECRRSRLALSAIFSYDRPDRFTVASVIRDAVLRTEQHPYGGIPDTICVDNGLELCSNHILQLTQGLGIELHPGPPGDPNKRATEESFFGTFNTQLWSTLPGYVSSNVIERNPHAKGVLTIAEVEKRFWQFIEQYHNKEHSSLSFEGTTYTPASFWQRFCWTEPADPRDIDPLLMEPFSRRVLRTGIKWNGHTYWHVELAEYVGQEVLIRAAAPTYSFHETIEVFGKKSPEDKVEQWICSAFAIETPAYQSITAYEVAEAQRMQRKSIRRRIKRARQAAEQANPETPQNTGATLTQPSPPPNQPQHDDVKDAPQTAKTEHHVGNRPHVTTQRPPPDLLDRMIEQERRT